MPSPRLPTAKQWLSAARRGDLAQLQRWKTAGVPTAWVPLPPDAPPNAPRQRYHELCLATGARSTALGHAMRFARVDYALALIQCCPVKEPNALYLLAGIRDARLPCAALAQALVNTGLPVDGHPGAAYAPMDAAIGAINPVAVAALLAAGASADGPPGHIRPLDRLARSDHQMPLDRDVLAILDLLVDAGADLDVPTLDQTPLSGLLEKHLGSAFTHALARRGAARLATALPAAPQPDADRPAPRPALPRL